MADPVRRGHRQDKLEEEEIEVYHGHETHQQRRREHESVPRAPGSQRVSDEIKLVPTQPGEHQIGNVNAQQITTKDVKDDCVPPALVEIREKMRKTQLNEFKQDATDPRNAQIANQQSLDEPP